MTVGPKPPRRLIAESFSTITAERTQWLWAGRIPLGSATLLVGREKLGKSTLTTELAARLSRGELPGELAGVPSATLIVSFEDSASRTIKPRLLAADAAMPLVHRVRATTQDGYRDLVTLPTDTDRIAELVRATGARLLVIDPWSASLDVTVNSHRDQDVRRALAPVVALAEDLNLAALLLAQWNKSPGGDALSRVLGSRGLTAAVRSVLAFGLPRDAEDRSPRRVLAHAACNVGPQARSLACEIETAQLLVDGEFFEASRLVIGEETADEADDLLSTPSSEERDDRRSTERWLAEELDDGDWHDKDEISKAAKADAITSKMLRTARERLGVEYRRTSEVPSRTQWRLPFVPSGFSDAGHDWTGHGRESSAPAGDFGVSDVHLRPVSDEGHEWPNGRVSDVVPPAGSPVTSSTAPPAATDADEELLARWEVTP